MELINQVCSRELAEKMKMLGFVQDSTFAWWVANSDRLAMFRGSINCIYSLDNQDFDTLPEEDDYISAYTVAELGEMLPNNFKSEEDIQYDLEFWKRDSKWHIAYWWDEDAIRKSDLYIIQIEDESLSEAIAKMLIYLAEQDLINPKEIKL